MQATPMLNCLRPLSVGFSSQRNDPRRKESNTLTKPRNTVPADELKIDGNGVGRGS